MQRVIILFAVFASVLANNQRDYEECSRIMDPENFCCEDFEEDIKKFKETTTECTEIPISPSSCEHETCLAKKIGFLNESDEYDYDAFATKLSELHSDPLLSLLKDKCFYNTQLAGYGDDGDCLLKKVINCITAHININCKSWKSLDDCMERKTIAENCATKY